MRLRLLAACVGSEIEPQGLYHTYATARAGHVVFAPWKTLARLTA